jgi:hypothetical protein
MRYSPMIGSKWAAIKAATDGSYRFIMLGLMLIEIAMLGVLVGIELYGVVHR